MESYGDVYRILAECDGHLFRKKYELSNRPHLTLFQLASESVFDELLTRKKIFPVERNIASSL